VNNNSNESISDTNSKENINNEKEAVSETKSIKNNNEQIKSEENLSSTIKKENIEKEEKSIKQEENSKLSKIKIEEETIWDVQKALSHGNILKMSSEYVKNNMESFEEIANDISSISPCAQVVLGIYYLKEGDKDKAVKLLESGCHDKYEGYYYALLYIDEKTVKQRNFSNYSKKNAGEVLVFLLNHYGSEKSKTKNDWISAKNKSEPIEDKLINENKVEIKATIIPVNDEITESKFKTYNADDNFKDQIKTESNESEKVVPKKSRAQIKQENRERKLSELRKHSQVQSHSQSQSQSQQNSNETNEEKIDSSKIKSKESESTPLTQQKNSVSDEMLRTPSPKIGKPLNYSSFSNSPSSISTPSVLPLLDIENMSSKF